MRQAVICCAFCFAIFAPLAVAQEDDVLQKAYEGFQRDADIVRLRHLQYWGGLIEDYKEKTGHYPFARDADVPVYVYVTSPEQARFVSGGPPYEHEVKPMRAFVDVLEKGLGRRIEEYYDPQYHPDFKPNFYIYMIHRDEYFFAVHLHRLYPFSGKVAKHYHKVEVTNAAGASSRAHSPATLFRNPAFRSALARPLAKPGFFLAREKRFLRATKAGNGH